MSWVPPVSFSLAPKMQVSSSRQGCRFSSEAPARCCSCLERLVQFRLPLGPAGTRFSLLFPIFSIVIHTLRLSDFLSLFYFVSSWIWGRKICNLCVFINEREKKKGIYLLCILSLSILVLCMFPSRSFACEVVLGSLFPSSSFAGGPGIHPHCGGSIVDPFPRGAELLF